MVWYVSYTKMLISAFERIFFRQLYYLEYFKAAKRLDK